SRARGTCRRGESSGSLAAVQSLWPVPRSTVPSRISAGTSQSMMRRIHFLLTPIICLPLCSVLWHRTAIWTNVGADSGAGNRLRQVILPTRPRHIVGPTMRIARGVETKIGIVNHIDEEARGKFERDLFGGM